MMNQSVQFYDLYSNFTRNGTSNGTTTRVFCQTWDGISHPLYQWAHLCFLAGFLIPRSQDHGVIVLRLCLTVGFALSSLWAYTVAVCSIDILVWSISFLVVNLIHVIWLLYAASPPRVPRELLDVYNRLFIPLKVTKKEFKELVRYAEIKDLLESEKYAVEGVSRIDERFSILLRGKLSVTCENILLHQISPHEFIDSPEYKYASVFLPNGGLPERKDDSEDDCEEKETRLGETIEETKPGAHPGDIGVASESLPSMLDAGRTSQVTITAVEPSKYLCWDKQLLIQETLAGNMRFQCILHNLIGKDITHKLYLLNEAHRSATEKARSRLLTHDRQRRSSNIPLHRLSKQEIAWWRNQLPRSLSVDAFHINKQNRRRSSHSPQPTKLSAVSHLQLLPETSPVMGHRGSMGPTLMPPPGYCPLTRIPEPSEVQLEDGPTLNNVHAVNEQAVIPSINVINASRLNISRSKEDYFNDHLSDEEEAVAQKEPLLGTQMIKLKAFGF